MRQGSKVLSINMPNDLINFFENWAKEELEDDSEVNWVVISKRRNELMIDCLNKVVEGEDE